MNTSIFSRFPAYVQRISFAVLFVFGMCLAHAQIDSNDLLDPIDIVPYLITPTVAELGLTDMDSIFEDYTIYNFEFSDVHDTAYADNYGFYFDLQLGSKNFESVIWRRDIRSDDWKAVATSSAGQEVIMERVGERDGSDVDTWVGMFDNHNKNSVRLVILEDNFYGFFYDEGEDEYYWVQSLWHLRSQIGLPTYENHENKLIFFKYSHLISQLSNHGCGSLTTTGDDFDIIEVPDFGHECAFRAVEIATDADHSFYNQFDHISELNDLRERSALNNIRYNLFFAEERYAIDFRIMFSLTYQEIQTDPIPEYSSAYADNLLNACRIYRNATWTNVRRDVAILFSNGPKPKFPNDPKNQWVWGVAWHGTPTLQTVCGQYGYSLVCTPKIAGPERYTIIAHEVGHNLGAHHDTINSSPNCGLMCDPPQSYPRFNFFSPISKNQINNHLQNEACLHTITKDDDLHDHAWDWVPVWTNKGNEPWMGTWYQKTGDTRLFGDVTGDGVDEMICMSPDAKWCNINRFNCESGDWEHLWSNNATERINTFRMRENNKYLLADFSGDGKKSDVICISSTTKWATIERFNSNTNSFHFLWSNMGNYQLATGFFLNNFNKYVVGDFTGDGTDELLCFHPNGFAALINFSYNGTKYVATPVWNNLDNIGGIGSTGAHPFFSYIPRRYSSTSSQHELLVITGTWATIIRYNPGTQYWDWMWSQNGVGNHFANIAPLPLASSSQTFSGNFDGDEQDEFFHMNWPWLATADYNNGSFNKNWDNSNSAFFAKYFFVPHSEFHSVGVDPFKKSVIMINRNSTSSGTPITNSTYILSNRIGTHKRHSNGWPEAEKDDPSTGILVFPNPTDGIVYIRRSRPENTDGKDITGKYELVDVSGKVVDKKPLTDTEQQINLNPLPSGMYFLRIFDERSGWEQFRINKL